MSAAESDKRLEQEAWGEGREVKRVKGGGKECRERYQTFFRTFDTFDTQSPHTAVCHVASPDLCMDIL